MQFGAYIKAVCVCCYVCVYMCEYKVCEIASIVLWCGLEFRTRCISFIWSCYVSLTLFLVHSFHLTHYWVMLHSPVVYMWNPSLFSIVIVYSKPILRFSLVLVRLWLPTPLSAAVIGSSWQRFDWQVVLALIKAVQSLAPIGGSTVSAFAPVCVMCQTKYWYNIDNAQARDTNIVAHIQSHTFTWFRLAMLKPIWSRVSDDWHSADIHVFYKSDQHYPMLWQSSIILKGLVFAMWNIWLFNILHLANLLSK